MHSTPADRGRCTAAARVLAGGRGPALLPYTPRSTNKRRASPRPTPRGPRNASEPAGRTSANDHSHTQQPAVSAPPALVYLQPAAAAAVAASGRSALTAWLALSALTGCSPSSSMFAAAAAALLRGGEQGCRRPLCSLRRCCRVQAVEGGLSVCLVCSRKQRRACSAGLPTAAVGLRRRVWRPTARWLRSH